MENSIFDEKSQEEILEHCNRVSSCLEGVEMNKVIIILANLVDNYFDQLRASMERKKNMEEEIEGAIQASAQYLNHLLFKHMIGGDEADYAMAMKELQETLAEEYGFKPPTTQ